MKKILSGLGIMLLTAGAVFAGENARPDFSQIQSAIKEKFPEKYEEILKTAQSDICKARFEMMVLAKEAGLCPKAQMRKPSCPPMDCKPKCPEAKDCKPECSEAKNCQKTQDCEKFCGTGCPKVAVPGKDAPNHKRNGDFRDYLRACAELREKCPDQMIELDKKFIALEDEMYELAKANGIALPRKKVDIRRIRVAFPEELKQLESERKNMTPREFGQKIGELAEKLNQQ